MSDIAQEAEFDKPDEGASWLSPETKAELREMHMRRGAVADAARQGEPEACARLHEQRKDLRSRKFLGSAEAARRDTAQIEQALSQACLERQKLIAFGLKHTDPALRAAARRLKARAPIWWPAPPSLPRRTVARQPRRRVTRSARRLELVPSGDDGPPPPAPRQARLDEPYRRAAGLAQFIDRVAERGGRAEAEEADLDRLVEQIDAQRPRVAP